MEPIPKKNQYVYAVLLLMSSYVGTSVISLLGTALPDILCINNTDLKSASLIFIGYGFGKCIIPCLGVVINYSPVLPLLTTLALTLVSIFLVCVPNSTVLNMTAFIYLLIGTAGGVVDVARYALPPAIWNTSNVGFYFMSVGTGIATLATPLFTSQFVNNHRQTGSNSTAFQDTDCATNIEIPYTVFALFCILTAVGFAINNYSILSQGKQLEEPQPIENCFTKSNTHFIQICFYVTVLVLFVTITSCLMTVFALMVTYGLRTDRHIDIKKSSAITSLFGISLLLARMICTVIADKVRPCTLFWTSLILVNSSSILFLIFKDSSIHVLWLISALHGFGTGPMFVTMVTWTREYVPLSTRFISAILLMDNIGNLIHSTLTGILMDVYGANQFIYTIAGTRLSQVLLFLVLQFIGKIIKSK